jgi:diguanylate cyclase (GGDEF)-like protein
VIVTGNQIASVRISTIVRNVKVFEIYVDALPMDGEAQARSAAIAQRRSTEFVLKNEARSPIGVMLTLGLLGVGISVYVEINRYLVFAALVGGLNICSAVCAGEWLRTPEQHEHRAELWSTIQKGASALGGSLWGLAPFVIGVSSEAATANAILVIFQAALLTISVLSMGTDRERFELFAGSLVLFAAGTNAIMGGRLHFITAFGMVTFGLFMLSLQNEVGRTFVQNIALTLHNETLLADLSSANAALSRDNRQLQHLATTDPLTGVANRNGWEVAVGDAIGDGSTESMSAMIIADLDDFKSVNDSLGHEAGDQVLQLVARRFLASVKETDTVARLGGDEFGVLLNGIRSDEDLALITERLEILLTQDFVYEGKSAHITISLGSARHRAGRDPSAVLRKADQRLYEKKRSRAARNVQHGVVAQN